MPLRVEVVSPVEVVFSGEATSVTCRTSPGGEIAFLTGHVPFVGALAGGTVRIELTNGGIKDAQVSGGFVEVSDDRVTILSDG